MGPSFVGGDPIHWVFKPFCTSRVSYFGRYSWLAQARDRGKRPGSSNWHPHQGWVAVVVWSCQLPRSPNPTYQHKCTDATSYEFVITKNLTFCETPPWMQYLACFYRQKSCIPRKNIEQRYTFIDTCLFIRPRSDLLLEIILQTFILRVWFRIWPSM